MSEIKSNIQKAEGCDCDGRSFFFHQNISGQMDRCAKEGGYHVVCLSGGKDSTALLLLMVEKEMPIDLVLNTDTGMEFLEMYEHLGRVDDFLHRERGIHITTLRHPRGFEWLMFEEPKIKPDAVENRLRTGVSINGNGWPGIRVRWCTGHLKVKLVERELKRLEAEKNAVQYIGIAADEAWRCKDKRYPLVEWGITEKMALQACYDRGFDFGGLYEIYHRASCWCCPFQRIDELRKLRKHHPELWEKLMEMDCRAREQFGPGALGQFKQHWSVPQLETRFSMEDQGLSWRAWKKEANRKEQEERERVMGNAGRGSG